MVEAVERAAGGRLQPLEQPDTGVTYARKIDKSEAWVDWAQPAEAIERRVRAFDPMPGAAARIAGETVKLWRCKLEPVARVAGAPGTVLRTDEGGVVVACGRGALRLTELQRAGGKRLAAADFLRGFDLQPGMVFARPAL